MPSDESQTAEPPAGNHSEQKPAVTDPRDDLREQVAVHSRDLRAFLARRTLPRPGQNATRH